LNLAARGLLIDPSNAENPVVVVVVAWALMAHELVFSFHEDHA
jgi:hypothetical protein